MMEEFTQAFFKQLNGEDTNNAVQQDLAANYGQYSNRNQFSYRKNQTGKYNAEEMSPVKYYLNQDQLHKTLKLANFQKINYEPIQMSPIIQKNKTLRDPQADLESSTQLKQSKSRENMLSTPQLKKSCYSQHHKCNVDFNDPKYTAEKRKHGISLSPLTLRSSHQADAQTTLPATNLASNLTINKPQINPSTALLVNRNSGQIQGGSTYRTNLEAAGLLGVPPINLLPQSQPLLRQDIYGWAHSADRPTPSSSSVQPRTQRTYMINPQQLVMMQPTVTPEYAQSQLGYQNSGTQVISSNRSSHIQLPPSSSYQPVAQSNFGITRSPNANPYMVQHQQIIPVSHQGVGNAYQPSAKIAGLQDQGLGLKPPSEQILANPSRFLEYLRDELNQIFNKKSNHQQEIEEKLAQTIIDSIRKKNSQHVTSVVSPLASNTQYQYKNHSMQTNSVSSPNRSFDQQDKLRANDDNRSSQVTYGRDELFMDSSEDNMHQISMANDLNLSNNGNNINSNTNNISSSANNIQSVQVFQQPHAYKEGSGADSYMPEQNN